MGMEEALCTCLSHCCGNKYSHKQFTSSKCVSQVKMQLPLTSELHFAVSDPESFLDKQVSYQAIRALGVYILLNSIPGSLHPVLHIILDL